MWEKYRVLCEERLNLVNKDVKKIKYYKMPFRKCEKCGHDYLRIIGEYQKRCIDEPETVLLECEKCAAN